MTADSSRLEPMQLDMVLILATALGGSLLVNVSTRPSLPSTFVRVITRSSAGYRTLVGGLRSPRLAVSLAKATGKAHRLQPARPALVQ